MLDQNLGIYYAEANCRSEHAEANSGLDNPIMQRAHELPEDRRVHNCLAGRPAKLSAMNCIINNQKAPWAAM